MHDPAQERQPEEPLPFFCRVRDAFHTFARQSSNVLGSAWAFILAIVIIVVWGATGPTFHFSDTWQLVMNTITSIMTFLMVFLLQRSQNKDSLAMQIKLNEILGAIRGASNLLINVEDLPEDQVRALHERYQKLCEKVKANGNVSGRLSIAEEASQGSSKRTP